MGLMTVLGAIGRQVRWFAGAFALVDLLVTGYLALARVPADGHAATWLLGSAAAAATFSILTAVGVGLQIAGELLRHGTPLPVVGAPRRRPH